MNASKNAPRPVTSTRGERAPLVHVVMLVHNNWDFTERAIDSLRQMTYPNFKVVIVDNASSDETMSVLAERYADVEVLRNEVNIGFAAGMNVGIATALTGRADFILCINNDVEVETTMLERLVEAMSPEVGAAAPLIYSLDDPTRIWSTGFTQSRLLLEARGGNRGMLDPGGWPDRLEVDYLEGCATLFPSSVLREVGQFDPRYFFFYEDRDLCLRISRSGYRLIVVPSAKMWHEAGASGSALFRQYQLARSSVIFFLDNTRSLQRAVVCVFRLGSMTRRCVGFAVRGKFALLQSYCRGIRDGWRSLQRSKG